MRFWLLLSKTQHLKGSAKRNEDVGTEPFGSGAARYPKHNLQERPHLLPRLLSALSGVLQTGARWGGGFPEKHVQSIKNLKLYHHELHYDNGLLLIKVLCGTDPHPTDHRAKKYRVEKHNLSKVNSFYSITFKWWLLTDWRNKDSWLGS